MATTQQTWMEHHEVPALTQTLIRCVLFIHCCVLFVSFYFCESSSEHVIIFVLLFYEVLSKALLCQ